MKIYFAYGSNMSASRMKKRLGWEAFRQSASLKGFELVFDQSGFNEFHWSPANIKPVQEGVVEGILYEVEEKDLKILDNYEKYYQRLEVEVLDSLNHAKKAVTYLSQNPRETKPPTQEYLNFLLEGKAFLSRSYFEKISQIPIFKEKSLFKNNSSDKE